MTGRTARLESHHPAPRLATIARAPAAQQEKPNSMQEQLLGQERLGGDDGRHRPAPGEDGHRDDPNRFPAHGRVGDVGAVGMQPPGHFRRLSHHVATRKEHRDPHRGA